MQRIRIRLILTHRQLSRNQNQINTTKNASIKRVYLHILFFNSLIKSNYLRVKDYLLVHAINQWILESIPQKICLTGSRVVFVERFKSFFVIGEKRTFCELIKIVTIAVEANSLVRVMFRMDYDEEKLTEKVHTLRELEKKADKVAYKLGENITGGTISPNVLNNLLECVQIADNIVDAHYFLGRELYRVSKARCEAFVIQQEPIWSKIYEKLLGLAEKSLLKLEKALSSSNMSEILELRKQIEDIEERGDDIKDAAFDRLYTAGPKLHYLQFCHYSDLLSKCDEILDSCEDLSILIVSIITSILK